MQLLVARLDYRAHRVGCDHAGAVHLDVAVVDLQMGEREREKFPKVKISFKFIQKFEGIQGIDDP